MHWIGGQQLSLQEWAAKFANQIIPKEVSSIYRSAAVYRLVYSSQKRPMLIRNSVTLQKFIIQNRRAQGLDNSSVREQRSAPQPGPDCFLSKAHFISSDDNPFRLEVPGLAPKSHHPWVGQRLTLAQQEVALEVKSDVPRIGDAPNRGAVITPC